MIYKEWDVIVVGGGHGGCEAALAAARMGCKTLLLVINLDTIGQMSCNPAIGGMAKGHLVKEIDALGGEMAKNIDATGIQFRQLNTKKGPAVRSSRAQADKQQYRFRLKWILENQENLSLHQALVEKVLVKNGRVIGVQTSIGEFIRSRTVVLAPGTFLRGLIHIGLTHFPGGRIGELPSIGLSDSLKELGFEMKRLKTGTTPRLDGRTIDFPKLEPQYGDNPPKPFSHFTPAIKQTQIPCYITYTHEKTHEIIRNSLDRSPLYSGIIKGIGPRYCPSIEDKVVRFADKDRHQIFLEPEGLNTTEIYPNGISTSLPFDVQIKMIRTIEGLERAEIVRPGYAIEYDCVDPTQLKLPLETKSIENLFLAGQINGTSGYEEASAQGMIAGINAALKVMQKEPFTLDRSEAYIGVLIDDLVTKGTNEPYRMFTSRAEYRLLLREDNADQRLMEKGYCLGLINQENFEKYQKKMENLLKTRKIFEEIKLYPNGETNQRLLRMGLEKIKGVATLKGFLKRPEVSFSHLLEFMNGQKIPQQIMEELEIETKYEGYIRRQMEEIEKFKKFESLKIPHGFDYYSVPGLSHEVKEKLSKIAPLSLGQASRISGITPAAISVLMIYLKKSSLSGIK